MLLFCPNCGTILTISLTTSTAGGEEPSNRLECRTCPYNYVLNKTSYFERRKFVHEKREDIFGGAKSWDDAQKTTVQCSSRDCAGMEAAFYSVQIRSADEPMTNFYKCMTCGTHWRD